MVTDQKNEAPPSPAAVAATESLKAPWGICQPPEAPTPEEKTWGMLANIAGLVFVIGPLAVLFLKGSSKFVKFYALQMLFYCVAMLVVGIVLGICFTILAAIPVVGTLIITVISPLISLASLALLVFLALKANSGVVFRLPVVGQMAYNMAYPAK